MVQPLSTLRENGQLLALDGTVLRPGDVIEVWYWNAWMQGKLEYCQTRYAHRLWMGECCFDVRAGMMARWPVSGDVQSNAPTVATTSITTTV